MCRRILWLLMLLPIVAATAEPDIPPPPPLIEGAPGPVEPQVRIIPRREATIEEYRVGGQLYMVRIIPRWGRPYYLVDADGDGNLETRLDEFVARYMLPGWVIFRW